MTTQRGWFVYFTCRSFLSPALSRLFPRNQFTPTPISPNSVPLSFRIGHSDSPVAPDSRVTTDRSATDQHRCWTINQPPAGICSSMANKHARLMIYHGGVFDMYVHCSRSMYSKNRFSDLSLLRGRNHTKIHRITYTIMDDNKINQSRNAISTILNLPVISAWKGFLTLIKVSYSLNIISKFLSPYSELLFSLNRIQILPFFLVIQQTIVRNFIVQ